MVSVGRASIHNNLVVRFDPARLQEDRLNLRREDIDTANGDHVVSSSNDTFHPGGGAPTGAFLARQARAVSRPITDQWQRLFCHTRQDKLSHFAVRHGFVCVGVNDLGNEVILENVHPLLLCALDRHARAHRFGQAVNIESQDAQARFDLLSHALRPGFCAEDSHPQRKRRQVDSIFLGHLGDA